MDIEHSFSDRWAVRLEGTFTNAPLTVKQKGTEGGFERFAVEGNLTDVVTTSPFESFDDRDVPGFKVPEPHNVHTSLGIRWRF